MKEFTVTMNAQIKFNAADMLWARFLNGSCKELENRIKELIPTIDDAVILEKKKDNDTVSATVQLTRIYRTPDDRSDDDMEEILQNTKPYINAEDLLTRLGCANVAVTNQKLFVHNEKEN